VKIKQRAADFRVREVLKTGFPETPGEHSIYRVTKSKYTTLEIVDRLAHEAGVDKRNIGFAGLKDRQGITTQYMSVEGGQRVQIQEPGLRIECIGNSNIPLASASVTGNSFDITVRELNEEDVRCYRRAREVVRTQGIPNYFDDQRFGALRHGQGFIVKEMIDGELESALKRILLYPSPFDPPRDAAFKGRLRRAWGDFQECVKLCRGGKHLSVFQHLAKEPGDFAGAFRFVSQRIRLIHLYSYQSYLWNLCVSEYLRRKLAPDNRLALPTDMGTILAFAKLEAPDESLLSSKTFPLLAPETEFHDPEVRSAVETVLEREKLTLSQLCVPGVEGFAFKPEERPLLVVPRHWRSVGPDHDDVNRGAEMLRLRFELPRGSYATMVVKRLFASPPTESMPAETTGPSGRAGTARPGARPFRKKLGLGIRESGDLPASMLPKEPFDEFAPRKPRGNARIESNRSADYERPRAPKRGGPGDRTFGRRPGMGPGRPADRGPDRPAGRGPDRPPGRGPGRPHGRGPGGPFRGGPGGSPRGGPGGPSRGGRPRFPRRGGPRSTG
jgi:tRNA pseudouridine13 synthase